MLELKNIKFKYTDKTVLDDLSLEIPRGEISGILGMNGAGKTTLFNCLYGTLLPDSGEISFHQKALTSRQIGFLETENYFYPYMKGREYLQLLNRGGDAAKVEGWNEIFDLPLDKLVDEYSTGMRKKIALMGLLLKEYDVFILDEPFNGVDIESNEKIFHILKKIKEKNKIILISSHILSSLTGLCDKINHLEDGKIVKTYSKTEFDILSELLTKRIKNQVNLTLDKLL